MYAHLGRGVHGEPGQLAADERSKPNILHYYRVRVQSVKLRRKIQRGGKLAVQEEGVERDMRINAPQMAVIYRFTQRVARKIRGGTARVERAAAEIDRVGAAAHGRSEAFHIARRG